MVNHILVDRQIEELIEKIQKAKSPVIYVGNGVRLANRTDEFISVAEKLQIPVVTAISGSDIIWHDHPLYFGNRASVVTVSVTLWFRMPIC